MISDSDRVTAVELINEARASGCRLKPACDELNISPRTYQRWTKEDDIKRDQRPLIVIAKLNERLGTTFTEMDKVIEQFVEDMAKNPEMQLRAKNPMDMFQVAYENNIMDVVIARLQQNQDFCTKYIEDSDFRGEIDRIILPLVHERIATQQQA